MFNKADIVSTEEDIGIRIRYDHIYKVIIIGDSGVGKTSLLSKYVKGIFPSSPFPTIAIEFATKVVQLREGGYIKAQIWDTAGQEKYKSITSHHYRRAVGGLIVYDITRRNTFLNAIQWLSELRNCAEKGCIIALIGNKVDLLEKTTRKREVIIEEGERLAKENGLLFYETSAQSNYQVCEAFEDLLQKIYTERRKIVNINRETPKHVINLKFGTTVEDKDEKECCLI